MELPDIHTTIDLADQRGFKGRIILDFSGGKGNQITVTVGEKVQLEEVKKLTEPPKR